MREQPRARQIATRGFDAALVVLIMVVGSLVLWVGVPFAWLFVGGRVQGATDSVGAAIGISMVGAVASIMGIAWLLARLNGVHQERKMQRGEEPTPLLEMVMVLSAAVALVVFVVWFFLIEGPGPSIAPSD